MTSTLSYESGNFIHLCALYEDKTSSSASDTSSSSDGRTDEDEDPSKKPTIVSHSESPKNTKNSRRRLKKEGVSYTKDRARMITILEEAIKLASAGIKKAPYKASDPIPTSLLSWSAPQLFVDTNYLQIKKGRHTHDVMDVTFDNINALDFCGSNILTSSQSLADVVAEAVPPAPNSVETALMDASNNATKGRPRKPYHASDPIPTELLSWKPPRREQNPSSTATGALGEEVALLDALKEVSVGQPPRRYKASDPIPTDLLSWKGSTAPEVNDEVSLVTSLLDALYETKVNQPYKATDPIPTELLSWSRPQFALPK